MPCLLQSCYHFRDELLVLSGLFNKYLHCLLYLACSFFVCQKEQVKSAAKVRKNSDICKWNLYFACIYTHNNTAATKNIPMIPIESITKLTILFSIIVLI